MLHETWSIEELRYGVSDRGSSIPIPMGTANYRFEYLENWRPSANMDPFNVCAALIGLHVDDSSSNKIIKPQMKPCRVIICRFDYEENTLIFTSFDI